MDPLPSLGHLFQGRYELTAIAGEGGFARVYHAHDIELGRAVAVKILRPGGEGYDERQAARFLREAKSVARLNSPHIVTIFDFGRTDDGLLYTVFELLAGRDLDTMMAEGPLDEAVVVRVLHQVLEALADAHDVGLLHRDVKPSNIRVYEYMGDRWCVKLLDFGIAKAQEDASLTATGMVVGTPRFMAPEQLYQEPLGPYTDLYSLGLTAYEMLVGAPSDHIQRLIAKEPVELPPAAPVSEALRRVLHRMLQRQAVDRYASARAVLGELKSLERDHGADAHRPAAGRKSEGALASLAPTPPEPRAPAPRTPRWLAPVAALGIVGVATVVGPAMSGDAISERDVEVLVPASLTQLPGREPEVEIQITPILDGGPRAAVIDAGAPGRADDTTSGCSGPPSATGLRRMSLRRGLDVIEWLAYIPSGYRHEVPHPLIVLFHDDAGATASEALQVTSFTQTAERHQFVIVAPLGEAMAYPWTDSAVIDEVERAVAATGDELCIDPARIFLVGQGAGGWGVESLSCRDWVAGAAYVSFAVERSRSSCTPARPVPTLTVLPMRTGYMPPQGGPDCLGTAKLSFDEIERRWRAQNECTSRTTTFASHRRDRCLQFDCEQPYVSCRIDAGRRWAGAPLRAIDLPQCDGPATDFPHNETIWKFFASIDRSTP